MPKMREVNRKKNAAKAAKANEKPYTLAPVVINGQTVMMKVFADVAAPKTVTARC